MITIPRPTSESWVHSIWSVVEISPPTVLNINISPYSAKAAVEAELKKRDAELLASQAQFEEEQESGQKKDRVIKDLNNKIHDLEEELEVSREYWSLIGW